MVTPSPLQGFSLAGRTALVTGASSGLGERAMRVLSAAGAQVIGAARRLDAVRATAAELRDEGLHARAVEMDVSDDASVSRAFDSLDASGLRANIVINVAGIAASVKWRDNDAVSWQRLLQTNLLGPERVSQAAATRLVAAGEPGCIVHVASTLGLTVQPGTSMYAASKAALMHLTRSMALELAPRRIRVNCLAPGLFRTPMTADFVRHHGDGYFRTSVTRRMGEPEEIDGALVFLASEASRYVNGVVLPVDGGNHLRGL